MSYLSIRLAVDDEATADTWSAAISRSLRQLAAQVEQARGPIEVKSDWPDLEAWPVQERAIATMADVRMTVEGDVLAAVTKRGGELIIAGPPMSAMVGELTDIVLAWRAGERL